jgi:hypothetical protein
LFMLGGVVIRSDVKFSIKKDYNFWYPTAHGDLSSG